MERFDLSAQGIPSLYVREGRGALRQAKPTEILAVARQTILGQTIVGQHLASLEEVHDFLRVRLNASLPREVFAVLYLDSQCHLLAFDEPFSGTLTACHVYARELVRAALFHNAASVILAHNHVSGCARPSEADIKTTRVLRDALSLVGTAVQDHVIIAGPAAVSMRELGWL